MPPDAMAAVEKSVVTEEPAPVSPIGFSTLSGLIGIALGVIIAPWIERLNRSNRLYDEEEK
jgi:xanthosine utilization system XapX-like protein